MIPPIPLSSHFRCDRCTDQKPRSGMVIVPTSKYRHQRWCRECAERNGKIKEEGNE